MKNALVCEGGGMRGVFCAGVLDYFLENSYDPFDLYIGVSAGACNLGSHLARQGGRNLRLYTGPMAGNQFISLKSFLKGGHYMDLDWFWDYTGRHDPLDVNAAIDAIGGKDFLIVVTSVLTGNAVYLRPEREDLLTIMKASSAVPLMYRDFISLGDDLFTDGGISDPIPVRSAAERGATNIVVVRTRPSSYTKKRDLETFLTSLLFMNRPRLRKAIMNRPLVYNQAIGMIHRPPEGIRVWEIAPPDDAKTGRTTTVTENILHDYRLGRVAAAEFLDLPGIPGIKY